MMALIRKILGLPPPIDMAEVHQARQLVRLAKAERIDKLFVTVIAEVQK